MKNIKSTIKQQLESLVGQSVSIENEANEQMDGPVQFWMFGKLEAAEDAESDSPFYVRSGESDHGSIGVSFQPSRVLNIHKGAYIHKIVLK